MKSGFHLDVVAQLLHHLIGLDTAAKSRKQQTLQPVLRLRHFCAGITFEGRVDFCMREIWKSVVGYEGYYDVSNIGRVRTDWRAKEKHPHFHAGKILKQHLICRYLRVALCGLKKKFRTVHSLVLEAFTGPRPRGKVSRHRDGNAFNNVSKNLIWGTQQQNVDDKQIHGTQTRGSKHGTSKIVESDVVKIRKLKMQGVTFAVLLEKFPIAYQTLFNIVHRKTWKHVP